MRRRRLDAADAVPARAGPRRVVVAERVAARFGAAFGAAFAAAEAAGAGFVTVSGFVDEAVATSPAGLVGHDRQRVDPRLGAVTLLCRHRQASLHLRELAARSLRLCRLHVRAGGSLLGHLCPSPAARRRRPIHVPRHRPVPRGGPSWHTARVHAPLTDAQRVVKRHVGPSAMTPRPRFVVVAPGTTVDALRALAPGIEIDAVALPELVAHASRHRPNAVVVAGQPGTG